MFYALVVGGRQSIGGFIGSIAAVQYFLNIMYLSFFSYISAQ
jgi:hypothetical protein